MIEWFAIVMGTSLFVLMIPVIYRICKGPTGFDRILGVNVIGTKTAVLLVIIGGTCTSCGNVCDFALTYALLNFVAAIIVSRYLNRTISLKEMEAVKKKKEGLRRNHGFFSY